VRPAGDASPSSSWRWNSISQANCCVLVRKCCQGLERLVGEELDQLRHQKARRLAVEGVHQHDGGDTLGVDERQVERGRAARVVTHQDGLVELQRIEHGFDITALLGEAVLRTLRLFGGAEAQEVDGDGAAAAGAEVRDKIVMDIAVIREPWSITKAGPLPG
jgi:hypothetical protein